MVKLFGFLLLVGVVLTYWQWIVGAVIIFLVFNPALGAWQELRVERAERAAAAAAVKARAELEDQWYLAGKPEGIYGAFPPAV